MNSNTRYFVIFLLAVAPFLLGCQPKVYLMPAPIGIEPHSLVFQQSENNIDSNLLYSLYATNRLTQENPLKTNNYTIFPSDSLRLGYVVHSVGEKNMNWNELQKISLAQERNNDLLIKQIWTREMAQYNIKENMQQVHEQADGFYKVINETLDRMPHKDLLVYVHGANSNFYRATAQGAQLFHFTGHNSIILTFSWPSAENILKYKTDVLHAKQTVLAFSRLLQVLAENTHAQNINIVAYSAGAQVVAPGLAKLHNLFPELNTDELKKKFRIDEVYFAAPDTDFAPFIDRYMKFRDIVGRTTININQNDSVLRFAAIQNGISRLGRPDPSELTLEEGKILLEAMETDMLDVLDVGASEALKLGGAHNSWYNHPWVSNDLLLLLLYKVSPKERGLVEYRLGNGATGYYFPKNYDEIIKNILNKGREEYKRHSPEDRND